MDRVTMVQVRNTIAKLGGGNVVYSRYQSHNEIVVLWKRGSDYDPWVVHRAYPPQDGTENALLEAGGYYSTKEAAIGDYNSR